MAMTPLFAYLISESSNLTVESQYTVETVKSDLLLKNFYLV